MDKLKLYFIKILKRVHLLKYLSFHLRKKINGVGVKIPFIYGMGISNYTLESSWLDQLINSLVPEDESAFVDVGVNIGQTLLSIKTNRPAIKYIGFEPNSACTFYSKMLINTNHFKNCQIFNFALNSEIEMSVLEKTFIDDPRASIIAHSRPNVFEDKEQVFAMNYDYLFLNQMISFVKIDVEFSELEVIRGMKNSITKFNPVIICEVLDSHDNTTHDFTQGRANELTKLIYSSL